MTLPSWKESLKNAITDPEILLQTLALPKTLLDDLAIGSRLFALRVPYSYLSRIEKGNPKDPLLLQILPLGLEADNPPDFVEDPLQEIHQNPLPGLLHKYHGRVLLITSGVCAVNCRYCFRRSFPYQENNPGQRGWQTVLKYIAADQSIKEVILSGGDPLTLTEASLQKLLEGLEAIAHVTTLRIHTRIPVVLPERIDSAFCRLFESARLNKVMVIHVNHPNELDAAVGEALVKLKACGFTLFNQSVLLRGVNDSAETQIVLQQKLFACGVTPYYLHLLDPVKGAAHFAVPLAEAKMILRKMMDVLPGYLVPKLAQEIPGEKSKRVYISDQAEF